MNMKMHCVMMGNAASGAFLMIAVMLGGCDLGGIGGGQGGDPGGLLPSTQSTLTVSIEGQGEVDPASGSFEAGIEVTLTARPAEGWRFDHWEGDLIGGPYDHWYDATLSPVNPSTLVMDADRTVMAVFVARQTQTETFDLGSGVELAVIHIAAGTFTMGSTDQERAEFAWPGVTFDRESPQHTVTISPFAMGETEVTQTQFERLMGYVPNVPEGCMTDCFQIALGDEVPAAWVSWSEAVAFCDALSTVTGRLCRLPTEAEWEYACRAASTTAFPFGDADVNLGNYAWWSANSGWPTREVNPHEVAGKLPNAWGLYDMHGNVWEWVGDWYDAYPAGGQADSLGPPTPGETAGYVDPTGPKAPTGQHSHKLLRGGAYNRYPWALRSAYRYDVHFREDIGSRAQFNFGFRVVCE